MDDPVRIQHRIDWLLSHGYHEYGCHYAKDDDHSYTVAWSMLRLEFGQPGKTRKFHWLPELKEVWDWKGSDEGSNQKE